MQANFNFLLKKGVLIHKLFVFGGFQEDVFQLIGVPLVKNALAGYNTSILSYGQVLFRIYILSSQSLWLICVSRKFDGKLCIWDLDSYKITCQ